MDKGYAQPDALVSTEWLAAHLHDRSLRILESDEDVLGCDAVRNYDGSWTEWGNTVRAPVEIGAPVAR